MEFNKDLNVAIINHRLFLETLYGNTKEIDSLLQSFDIKTPFRMDLEAEKVAISLETGSTPKKKKKRKMSVEDEIFQSEIVYLQKKLTEARQLLNKYFPGSPSLTEIRENNKSTRQQVKLLLESLREREVKNIPQTGKHEGEEPCQKDGILFPPRSAFTKLDISQLSTFRDDLGQFDVILLDPPWQNKHVKRHKHGADGYCLLENQDLVDIPVEKFLCEDGIVLVWTTNNRRHREAVDEMFLRWDVVKLTIWYWVKLTTYGQLVCDFSHSKQPYEVCIVGQSRKRREKLDAGGEVVIMSVPSAIQSHKPPLDELLAALTGNTNYQEKRKLEIFGRNLSPGWVTVGNQPCFLNLT